MTSVTLSDLRGNARSGAQGPHRKGVLFAAALFSVVDQRAHRLLTDPRGLDVHHPGGVEHGLERRVVPPPEPLRHQDPARGEHHRHRRRHGRRRAHRPGRRDLPLRVRQAARAAGAQAGARDHRRRAQRRHRVLRAHVHLARHHPAPEQRHPAADVVRGRPRGGDPHHPDRGVGLGGRDAVGAELPARSLLRHGRQEDHDRRAGGVARRGVRPGRGA